MDSSSQSPPNPNNVQPYRMHVSQKYLDLTKQKLELTRLPRDPRNVQRGWDFGVSKSVLEPMIDHWLERYDWRSQETFYNDTLPQFRVPINGTRLHFVHKRSTSLTAIPLIFVHGWPESFIGVSKMIDALSNPITTPPRGDDTIQAFHVVAPSIPGFGFSDPIPEAANNLQATAEVFDALMKGLGYRQYICHGSGWGFKICRVLALAHPESCIGVHTVNPEVPAPRSSFGYTAEDMYALSGPMSQVSVQPGPTSGLTPPITPVSLGQGSERPQTTSYALCDSPSGLLAHVVDAIRSPPISSPSPGHSPAGLHPSTAGRSPTSPQSYNTSPQSSRSPRSSRSPQSPATSQSLELGDVSNPWTETAFITWAMMHWLPGPEVALRWLVNSGPLIPSLWTIQSSVPLGISHYRDPIPGIAAGQTPPQWAEAYHRVAMVRRREGSVRFAAWERPAEIVMDIREFADLLSTGPAMHVLPMGY